MGYGNCILALDTVFNREVLEDTGLFFSRDPADLAALIRRIEADPSLVSSLQRKAPIRIKEHYSWDKVSDQYAELFLKVASGA
jgi:glycosyltransferase involved in cell wall biosynthesis